MKLLKLSSLPDWYRDNDYIKTGYRPPKESFKHCLKSLFSIHNETANIYSHLLGALLFVILWIYTFNYPLYQKFGLIDKLVFSSFFIGIITCLLISASFHTFNCHSRDIFKLFAKLDYCGISLLIILSFVPWVYYGFYYSVIPRIIYLSLTALLGIACIVVSIFDRFSDPQYRKLRAILFICDGLSGIIPSFHWALTHRFSSFAESASSTAVTSIVLLILMGMLYIMGAIFYMTKFPERLYPGKFDLLGNSHQIFHIFVIIAALTYYFSMKYIADARLNHLIVLPTDLPLFEVVIEH